MKIAVDAMGGDHAPKAVVDGVVDALSSIENVHLCLVGDEEKIKAEVSQHSYPPDRLSILHAPEAVQMNESAITPIRKKKKSSIAIGIQALKNNQYDAFLSAGNTGAVVAASTIHLGMIDGVERPAIGICIPTLNGFAMLIDVGANTDPKPRQLMQSAILADVYMRDVAGVATPKIGLLNIGTEESKGTGFHKDTHKLMEAYVNNFIGNLEANELYKGRADIVICDGYVGNIVLKVSEGLLESIGLLLKREIKKSPIAQFGALMMSHSLKHLKKLVDYSEYGGAPLLGVDGVVVICHGRSSPKAIKNAILATKREVESQILKTFRKKISKSHESS